MRVSSQDQNEARQLIALLLALPSCAFAEDLDMVASGNVDPAVEETGPIELGGEGLSAGLLSGGLTIDHYDEVPEELPGPTLDSSSSVEDAPPAAFDRSVTVDGVTVTVTASAGAFPEAAELDIKRVESDAIAKAAESAVGADGVYTHRLFRVGVQDDSGNAILPDKAQGVPHVCVNGLNLTGDASVVMIDEGTQAAREISAVFDADAVEFDLAGNAVYDILTIAPAPPEETSTGEQPPADDAQPVSVAFDQSVTIDGVVVRVQAEPGVFPANAALSVTRALLYEQQQADAAVEDARPGDVSVAVRYRFDIQVIDPLTHREYQPAEGQTVNVSFSVAEVADENLTTSVYHIDDSGAAEKLPVVQEDEVTATVETDGFSIYTVEFTYGALEYVLPGDSSVAMSEILDAIGLTGEVTAVAVSDTRLFSASDATGEWIVTALRPFHTTEWMKVTINGVAYEITVTDDDTNPGGDEGGGDPGQGGVETYSITYKLNGGALAVGAGAEDYTVQVSFDKNDLFDVRCGLDNNTYDMTDNNGIFSCTFNTSAFNGSLPQYIDFTAGSSEIIWLGGEDDPFYEPIYIT